MASHRMPESERPRRPVPAWVTAPPEDDRRPTPDRTTGLGTPTVVASAAPAVGSGREAQPTPATPALDPDAVVPDYPPQQELLPPAPTSPSVDTIPFARVASAPAAADGHPVALAAGAPGAAAGVASPAHVRTTATPSQLPGRDGSAPVAAGGATAVGSGAAAVGAVVAGAGAGAALVAGAAAGTAAADVRGTAAVAGSPDLRGTVAVAGAPVGWTPPAVGLPTAPAPLHSATPQGDTASAAVPAQAPAVPGRPADGHRGAHVLGAVPTGAPVAAAVTPSGTATTPTLSAARSTLGGIPPQQPPAPVVPVVPSTGQPRFSVPGLEHMVVEGTEPAPGGPIGYRTPARFAHQQAVQSRPLPPSVTTPPPAAGAPVLGGAAPATAPSFDAVIAPPAPAPSGTPTASASTEARFTVAVVPTVQLPAVPLPAGAPVVAGSTTTEPADTAVDLPTPLDAPAPPTPASGHRNAVGRASSAWSRLRRRAAASTGTASTTADDVAASDHAADVTTADHAAAESASTVDTLDQTVSTGATEATGATGASSDHAGTGHRSADTSSAASAALGTASPSATDVISGGEQAAPVAAAVPPTAAPLPPVGTGDDESTRAAAPGLPTGSDATTAPGDGGTSRARRTDRAGRPARTPRAGRTPKAERTATGAREPKPARPARGTRTAHAHRAGQADAPVAPADAAVVQPGGVTTPHGTSSRAIGATPAAVLGALAGLGTIGLAAWWFTAPGTVHAVGLLLGLLAVVLSVTTLRDAAASWQRPVALLGLVLGSVEMLVLLWAVLSAVLPGTLPDITGTGAPVQLAP